MRKEQFKSQLDTFLRSEKKAEDIVIFILAVLVATKSSEGWLYTDFIEVVQSLFPTVEIDVEKCIKKARD